MVELAIVDIGTVSSLLLTLGRKVEFAIVVDIGKKVEFSLLLTLGK